MGGKENSFYKTKWEVATTNNLLHEESGKGKAGEEGEKKKKGNPELPSSSIRMCDFGRKWKRGEQ